MSMQDIKKYTSICLKLLSLGLVITAGSFWAGAGIDSRPKYRDEQTLVGGTIWSQIIIPIGLLISKTIGEELSTFIYGYYLVSGTTLLVCTGLVLIIHECSSISQQNREGVQRRQANATDRPQKIVSFKLQYDKVYLTIGILSLLAGILTLSDFIVLFI